MKRFATYIMIVVAAVALSVANHLNFGVELASALRLYRFERSHAATLVARGVENTMRQMYQGLRTIARLPGVRSIDRYVPDTGTRAGFDADARQTVQELYNNLAADVAMSEVYIVPADLEPDEIDPKTGRLQEPITTFDELIVGQNSTTQEAQADDQSHVEEIEVYEYRLMKRQLAWMRDHVPTQASITGLKYPALSGPEVVTCDNTRYKPDHPDDRDRSGFVYSVPFFGPNGRLKGCISGVILTHALRNLLPSGDYALFNRSYGSFIESHQTGQSLHSRRYAEEGMRDPALPYSEAIRLNIVDDGGGWTLWVGEPSATFWARSDVQHVRSAALLTHVAIWVFAAGVCTLVFLTRRNKEALEAANSHLEQRVSDRTAALQEAQAKAIVAARAKSDFLANMSHEIRTPMTAILGYAENLRDGELSESEASDAIETIHRNGAYLLGIINDILDASKIDAGKMEVEHIACAPWGIVLDVIALLKTRSDAKNLALNAECIGEIPETIQSDPTRLKQILINIVGNAIKFTQEGGVRLMVRFSADGPAPHMQFDIIDTGSGMTEEQVKNLFRPFAQADSTMTRKFGGTGLGLAISKSFAQMLGGDLTIEDSTPGFGTCFRATVATGPLNSVRMVDAATSVMCTNDAKPPKRSDAEKPLTCRILLAEDGPDNQRLISFVLTKAGADVTIAENGRVAFELAVGAQEAGKPFDIILMDMQMPVLDGYHATMALREMDYEGPIIALTAHAMAGDREKCLNSGCDDFVTKPVDRTKLIAVITKHVSQRMERHDVEKQHVCTVR